MSDLKAFLRHKLKDLMCKVDDPAWAHVIRVYGSPKDIPDDKLQDAVNFCEMNVNRKKKLEGIGE